MEIANNKGKLLRIFVICILSLLICMPIISCSDNKTDTESISDAKALVVGDVHLGIDDSVKNNFIKTLQYVKDNGIDVFICNGDLVNFADQKNYDIADECMTEVFGNVPEKDRPEFIFNAGNHEFYPTANCDCNETVYEREIELFKNFANKWMKTPIDENESVYIRTVKGLNYVVAFPGAGRWASCGEYLSSDFERLNSLLEKATEDGKPCVLATHWAWGYTYGGASYGMPNYYIVAKMKALLSEYPSVVNVTSHTHYPSLHERTFDQTNFTSVSVGAHCYGKYVSACESDEDGNIVRYMNVSERRIVNDPKASGYFGKTHFGILFDVGKDDLTVSRVNLDEGKTYEHGSWTIPFGITKENKHDKFYYEKNERSGETPEFADDTELFAQISSVSGEKATISLQFSDVENYWAAEGYKIEIYSGENELVCKKWWQSLYWADLEKKSDYAVTLDDIPISDGYTVKVYPLGFLKKYGEPLIKTINNQ